MEEMQSGMVWVALQMPQQVCVCVCLAAAALKVLTVKRVLLHGGISGHSLSDRVSY